MPEPQQPMVVRFEVTVSRLSSSRAELAGQDVWDNRHDDDPGQGSRGGSPGSVLFKFCFLLSSKTIS